MALNALAVKGIRAFDDKKFSLIEFFSPVTVIVGANGSGKTTIIECLKYATTGDQPPNTRGGAFVHDPGVANENDVKAQVNLRFQSADGDGMRVKRYLRVGLNTNNNLTVKKYTHDRLEAEDVGPSGERRVICDETPSTPEINAEIPRLLGVSKAVLENVIFCHQEESNWPLAQSGSLKKKFDEIFEATRYSKALTSIRDLIKTRVVELKVEKECLTSLQREKLHTEKINARISQLNSEITSKELEFQEAKERHEAMVDANRQLDETASDFREVFREVEILEEKKRILLDNCNEAKLYCKEILALTEEELQAKIASSEDDTNSLVEKRRVDEDRAKRLENELKSLRQKHNQISTQLGSLQSETEAQEARINERDQLIHETGAEFLLKTTDGADSFLSRLQEAVAERKDVYAKLNEILREKTDVFEAKQRELDNSLSKWSLEKENIRTSILERQSAIAETRMKLDNKTNLPARLEQVEATIREKRACLDNLDAEMRDAKWYDRIQAKDSEERQLEEAQEQLNRDLATTSLQVNDLAKLARLQTSIQAKTDEMSHIVSLVIAKLCSLGVDKAGPASLEGDVRNVAITREQQHSELETLYASLNAEFQQVQSTLLNSRLQLETRNEEIKALDERLASELQNNPRDEVETALKQLETEIDLRKARLGILRGGNNVYRSFLLVGKEQKTCSACKRHMNDQEFVIFEKCLQDMISANSSSELVAEETELKQWEDRVDALRKLRPVQLQRDQVRYRDIPLLGTQIVESETLVSRLSAKVSQTHQDLEEAKRELRVVDELKEQVRTITRLREEIARMSDEATSLGSNAGLTTRPLLDIQHELHDASTAIRRVHDERRKLQDERAAQKESISTLMNILQKAEHQELEIRRDIQDKIALEARVEKLNQEITVYRDRVQGLDAHILDSEKALKAVESEFRETRSGMVAEVATAQAAETDLFITLTKISDLHSQITHYVDEKRESTLEEWVSKSQGLDSQILELERSVAVARESCKSIDDEINSVTVRMGNWRENIRIRKLERELQETQADINSRDREAAARSRQEFDERYWLGKDEERRLNSLHSHLRGELETHRATLRGLRADLKDLGDTGKNYKEQLIRISEMANKDLEKYARALDTAIMRYHGLKMQEVNDTMRHLWNRIYQGTDIDGIKIVSDADEVTEGTTATRRYYNYRAIMTKDQVELDMRGRCSSGQKMLASIIVRLALADSFGQNCGILALDEPTNALDAENVEALADSLVELINERKSHSNFQLILITHDENFLRRLAQNDVLEYYWRVSRNERQKSEITKERAKDM